MNWTGFKWNTPEYHRAWYLRNQDRVKAKTNSRYHADPKGALERQKGYNSKNPDRRRKYQQKYGSENREQLTEYHRQWRSKNRGRWASSSSLRRAKVRNVTVDKTGIAEWMQFELSKDFSTCWHCWQPVPGREIHFDHIIPISRGGAHSLENLCVSCERCNLSKGAKLLSEWKDKPLPSLFYEF